MAATAFSKFTGGIAFPATYRVGSAAIAADAVANDQLAYYYSNMAAGSDADKAFASVTMLTFQQLFPLLWAGMPNLKPVENAANHVAAGQALQDLTGAYDTIDPVVAAADEDSALAILSAVASHFIRRGGSTSNPGDEEHMVRYLTYNGNAANIACIMPWVKTLFNSMTPALLQAHWVTQAQMRALPGIVRYRESSGIGASDASMVQSVKLSIADPLFWFTVAIPACGNFEAVWAAIQAGNEPGSFSAVVTALFGGGAVGPVGVLALPALDDRGKATVYAIGAELGIKSMKGYVRGKNALAIYGEIETIVAGAYKSHEKSQRGVAKRLSPMTPAAIVAAADNGGNGAGGTQFQAAMVATHWETVIGGDLASFQRDAAGIDGAFQAMVEGMLT